MSQSSNVNTGDNAIDSERDYCTTAVIKKVGRAVAVSLEDATLPGNAKNKHMAILYRKGKKWSDQEIQLIRMEAQKWIVENFGSDQAPVTFTIQPWGRKSMMIKGDLEELCLHLREQFASMSDDAQRVPYVEMFVGKAAKERMNGGNGKVKMCHICGGSDHYKKRCPMRDPKPKKHGHKGRAHKMKGKHSPKHSPKTYNPEKARVKLTKIMSRIQSQKEKKLQEIALLDAKQNQIAALLSNVDNLDKQTVNDEIKNIALSFKRHRKDFKKSCKRMRKRRSQQTKRDSKQMKFLMKQIRREEKDVRKQEKKAKREEKKRVKLEMKEKLTAARLSTLPPSGDDSDESTLFIHVDGYNLIGCDAECRKGMRGRRGGMKRSRQRLAHLLQEGIMDRLEDLNLGYNVRITLWFDGKGRSEKYGDIDIAFSTEQIVDDKLVQMFSAIKGNFLVVTSDRKLTVRLHDCGVMVMKSGTFYKKYLKVKEAEKMDVDDNDEDPSVGDEKEQDNETMEDSVADDFVHVITDKVTCGQNDVDEASPDGDSGDNDEETDDVPDEMEGSIHRYTSAGVEEGEDSDYLEIFGDEDDTETSE